MAEQASSSESLTLYTVPPDWQLPSRSVPCMQLEAYLRMAGLHFHVVHSNTSTASPTGNLPALENGATLLSAPQNGDQGASQGPGGPPEEFNTARDIIQYLEASGGRLLNSISSLNSHLSSAQRASAEAFASLIEHKLQPATLYCTWLEQHSFSKYTQGAVGSDLPFPLNYFVPWSARKQVAKQFSHTSAQQVYAAAAGVYKALAAHLSSNPGSEGYFFGPDPCTFDALLYPHLLYHLVAPVSPPALKDKVTEYPVLVHYVERITKEFWSTTMPQRPVSVQQGWAQATRESSQQESAEAQQPLDPKRRRNNWLWAGAVTAAMLGFWATLPHFPITVLTMAADDDLLEEDGDDDLETEDHLHVHEDL